MSWLTLFALACLAPAPGGQPAGIRPWKLDRILITFWCPPPATDEALSAVAAEGYNLTWVPEAGLDVARRHGLRAMLQDPLLVPAALDSPDKRAGLDALVARVKKHPAMAAYFITDEPSAAAFPALAKLADYLRERDPDHPAYINLFPTYASNQQLGTQGDAVTAYREHLRQYVETVKPGLISYDHYHFFKTGDGAQYFLNLGLVRQAALDAGVPFLNIIQASTIEPVWRLVNADELRWLVYTTLAYGGRGISYFLYWGPASYGGLYQDGKKTPLADDAAVLNREIAALSPPLMKLESLGAYHTAPVPTGAEAIPADSPVQVEGPGEYVLGLFGTRDRPTACMVVNRSYKQQGTATLRMPTGSGRVEEYDRAARRWRSLPLVDAKAVLTLAPGDGRLVRWER